MNNCLVHHGVKGQKWGVRHDPERSSKLDKYYDANNRINFKGVRKREKAKAIKNYSTREGTSRAFQLAGTTLYTGINLSSAKILNGLIHQVGNIHVNKIALETGRSMTPQGASTRMKMIGGAYIAAMMATKAIALYPAVSAESRRFMYRHNSKYRDKIDKLSTLPNRKKK